jgi:hypothetical protein
MWFLRAAIIFGKATESCREWLRAYCPNLYTVVTSHDACHLWFMIFLVQEQPSHRSWLSLLLIFLLWSFKLHNLTQFFWPGHLVMSSPLAWWWWHFYWSLAVAQNVMWPCYHVRKANRQFLLMRWGFVLWTGFLWSAPIIVCYWLDFLDYTIHIRAATIGKAPKGLCFAWILPNRQLRWKWQPCLSKNGRGATGCVLASQVVTTAWRSCSSWFLAD